LAKINSSNTLPHKLQTNNHAVNLNEETFSEHINHIAYFQGKGSITPEEAFAVAIEYTLVNEFDRAIEMFSASIEHDTHTALSYFGRGTAHFKYAESIAYASSETTKANNEIKAMHYKQAITNFAKVIELSPNFAEAYYNKAVAEIKAGDTAIAINDLERAIKIRPDYADAYFNKGIIHIKNGEKEKGIEELSKAGELGLYSAYSIIKKHQKQNQ
jgi:tetratricopeptide (TPR) repeat protein